MPTEVGGDALVRQLFAEFFPDLADYEETAWVGVARGYSTHSFISNSIFRLSFELPSKIPKLWKLLTFFDVVVHSCTMGLICPLDDPMSFSFFLVILLSFHISHSIRNYPVSI